MEGTNVTVTADLLISVDHYESFLSNPFSHAEHVSSYNVIAFALVNAHR
jgi:hypothetical protein